MKPLSPLATMLAGLLLISAMVPFVAIARGAVDFGPRHVAQNDVLGHPLLVVGGSVVISGETRAPLLVVFGNIVNYGRAGDDLVAVGGDVRLAAGSVVDGDVVALGGRIFRADNAIVS